MNPFDVVQDTDPSEDTLAMLQIYDDDGRRLYH